VSVATIKKNDTVAVRTGVEAGKTGKVLQVDRSKGRALVEGLRLVKKAQRKTEDRPQGGFAEKEAPIAVSNLALYCPECKQGVRIRRAREAGKTTRRCKRCGHAFEG